MIKEEVFIEGMFSMERFRGVGYLLKLMAKRMKDNF